MNASSTQEQLLALLKKTFGYSQLLPFQVRAMDAVLAGRDCFVIMATGAGKSLSYQLPPLVTQKTALVISPLISLMQNQVDALTSCRIKATFLGADVPFSVEQQAFQGDFGLVYLTPEKALNRLSQIKAMHQNGQVGLLAIDEAHCVSEWGHDFRPEYRRLLELRRVLPGVPCLCLTATATPQVQADVIENMELGRSLQGQAGVVTVKGSFNRPNLKYIIQHKSSSSSSSVSPLAQDLNPFFAKQPVGTGSRFSESGVTIVYTVTKRETDLVAAHLTSRGWLCEAYHAGLPHKKRAQVLESFLLDRLEVLVCTTAFGMGIDKSDIRRVIHYGIPKSIEAYYQQTGRAGRDGNPAECILLYTAADLTKASFLLEQSSNGQAVQRSLSLLQKMKDFIYIPHCRRQFILRYFGEADAPRCAPVSRLCDRCLAEQDGTSAELNLSREVFLMLGAVLSSGERFGLQVPVKVLRGAKGKKILTWSLDSSEFYGKGKDRPEKWWTALGRVLEAHSYLRTEQSTGRFFMLKLTQLGQEFYKRYRQWQQQQQSRSETSVALDGPVLMLPVGPELRIIASTASNDTSSRSRESRRSREGKAGHMQQEDELDEKEMELFDVLNRLRAAEATARKISRHIVFTNAHLRYMARARPLDQASFLKCEGVGVYKAEQYGVVFPGAIADFCKAHGLAGNLLACSTAAPQQAFEQTTARDDEMEEPGQEPDETNERGSNWISRLGKDNVPLQLQRTASYLRAVKASQRIHDSTASQSSRLGNDNIPIQLQRTASLLRATNASQQSDYNTVSRNSQQNLPLGGPSQATPIRKQVLVRNLSYAEKCKIKAAIRSLENALDGRQIEQIARSRGIKPETVLSHFYLCFGNWDGPALFHPIFKLWTADYFQIPLRDRDEVYAAIETESRESEQARGVEEEVCSVWEGDEEEQRARRIKELVREEISVRTIRLVLHLYRAERTSGKRLVLQPDQRAEGGDDKLENEAKVPSDCFHEAYMLLRKDKTKPKKGRLPKLELDTAQRTLTVDEDSDISTGLRTRISSGNNNRLQQVGMIHTRHGCAEPQDIDANEGKVREHSVSEKMTDADLSDLDELFDQEEENDKARKCSNSQPLQLEEELDDLFSASQSSCASRAVVSSAALGSIKRRRLSSSPDAFHPTCSSSTTYSTVASATATASTNTTTVGIDSIQVLQPDSNIADGNISVTHTHTKRSGFE
eukprot:gb/GEZN01000719.1/.p1 GENE.gb/GEZN01000719.1/~~gb/GEZN01000719.1/.p1  ORF type:complete len:1212 (+),score=207.98 gb/GEZN01000719.1/:93-3728(+)